MPRKCAKFGPTSLPHKLTRTLVFLSGLFIVDVRSKKFKYSYMLLTFFFAFHRNRRKPILSILEPGSDWMFGSR